MNKRIRSAPPWDDEAFVLYLILSCSEWGTSYGRGSKIKCRLRDSDSAVVLFEESVRSMEVFLAGIIRWQSP